MDLPVESLRIKFRNELYIPLTKDLRRRELRHEDFTIISNNCWGGTVYESYGIRKMSPTVGMFIMPQDFLKMVSDLDSYLIEDISFVSPDESKWRMQLERNPSWGKYLIAQIKDIELHMLHYHDPAEAESKWRSRLGRVNPHKMIYKFNDQNMATEADVRAFMDLDLPNKLCFVADEGKKITDDVILIRQPSRYKNGIQASREPFGKSRYLDVTAFINQIEG